MVLSPEYLAAQRRGPRTLTFSIAFEVFLCIEVAAGKW
jgi:hypothetical protein